MWGVSSILSYRIIKITCFGGRIKTGIPKTKKKILSLSQGDSPSCWGQITPKSLFSAGGGVAGPPCGRRCLWQWRRPDPLPHGWRHCLVLGGWGLRQAGQRRQWWLQGAHEGIFSWRSWGPRVWGLWSSGCSWHHPRARAQGPTGLMSCPIPH